MELKYVDLDSVDAYNKLYGFPTLHPLVTVVDLRRATMLPNYLRVHYGLYALYLKNGTGCTIKYGRRTYDYQEGTVVSFAPGQTVDVVVQPGEERMRDVQGILFHPDLIWGTPLGQKIGGFDFFDYTSMEAVHLSESERGIFLDCLAKIQEESRHPVDNHSSSLLSAGIQLLLEYMDRFYDRQFITRHKANCEIVTQFERRLREYYETPGMKDNIPSVGEFAAMANLSPKYFSELVKRETGTGPKTLIMRQMVNVAKHRLAASEADVAEIAYDLGFQHPAHFSRMFKRMEGMSPSEYRNSLEQDRR